MVYVRNEAEFIAYLRTNGTPDVISFDHDLCEEHYHGAAGYNAGSRAPNGEDLAKWAIENGFIPKIVIVHSWNPSGAEAIAKAFIPHTQCEKIRIRAFQNRQPHMWLEEFGTKIIR